MESSKGIQSPPARVLMMSYLLHGDASFGALRALRFAKYLPACGWEPVIVTAEKQPAYRVGASGDKFLSIHVAGTPESLESGPAAAAGREAGNGHMARCECSPESWENVAVVAGREVAARKTPSLLYSVGPPVVTHRAAWRLSQECGLPWVADWRPASYERSVVKRKASVSDLLDVEAQCVKHAERVIVDNPLIYDRLCSRYGSQAAEKVVVIPGGFDPELLDSLHVFHEAVPERSRRLRVCHFGSVTSSEIMLHLVEALRVLAQRSIEVELCLFGEIPSDPRLQQNINSAGLHGCLQVFPEVQREQALRTAASSDMLLVIHHGDTLEVKSKLFDMLVYRKPIVVVARPGATSELVTRLQIGAAASPKDPLEIALAIETAHANGLSDSQWNRRVEQHRIDGLCRQLSHVFGEVCHLSHWRDASAEAAGANALPHGADSCIH